MSVPVEKTLEEIRTEMFTRIGEVQDDYQLKGWLPRVMNLGKGVVRGLIELWSWGLFQLYSYLKTILSQAFPSTATGLWLDLHAGQIGLTRFAQTKTSGTVYFTRAGTVGNVPIPVGRVVRTLPDALGKTYGFVTRAAAVLADGSNEVAVIVDAVEYGSGSNVTAGQITEIVTYIPGVDVVENRTGWLISEGQDEESDEALRQRYVLAWSEIGGCTKYAYESWARSVAGVKAVLILDQHPRGQGTVDVVVLGVAGIPTAGLLDAVRAVIAEKKPINDDVLVKAPTPVTVNIDCTVEITGGDDAAVRAGIIADLQAYFTYDTGLSGVGYSGLAQDVMLDRLTQIVMNSSTLIKSCSFVAPVSDVVVAGDGLAVLGTVAVMVTFAGSI